MRPNPPHPPVEVSLGFREVANVYLRVYGTFLMALCVLAVFGTYLGQLERFSALLIIVSCVGNLALSLLAMRVPNPMLWEVVRRFVVGPVLGAWMFLAVEPRVASWWPFFYSGVFGTGALGFVFMGRVGLIPGQLACWLTVYGIAYFLKGSNPDPMIFVFQSTFTFASTLIMAQITSALSRTLRNVYETRQGMIQSSKLSALGEMAGGIAHEINNPLAILMAAGEQLQELMDEEPQNRQLINQSITRIQHTTQRISRIVTGLRNFTREGSQEELQPVSVAASVRDALSLCAERFRQNGWRVDVDSIPEDAVVIGRQVQLTQALLNLLNNAHDATEKLAERWIRVGYHVENGSAALSVTDSGGGIPDEVRQKLFQPFFTTKEIGKGTGLGLSISKGLIESFGGALEYDAQSTNTRFVIRVPMRPSKLQAG